MTIANIFRGSYMVTKTARKKPAAAESVQLPVHDIYAASIDRLAEMLKDSTYLKFSVDNEGDGFLKVPVTRDLLGGLVKYPFVGFNSECWDLNEMIMRITESTLNKFIARVRETKPSGSTTERTAIVFDYLDRYETCIKADSNLLANSKGNKDFVNTKAFKSVWDDIISVSQMLTMTSLLDMKKYMEMNGDLDDVHVQHGVLRRV